MGRPNLFRSPVQRLAPLVFLPLLLCPTRPAGAQAATAPQQTAPSAAPTQFFLRLVPPRTTFATDMTADERALMQQHATYWAEQFKTGKVLIIGPVTDPKGAFGMAVLECTEAEAQAMANGDPSVKAGLNKVEVLPMHVFLRKQ